MATALFAPNLLIASGLDSNLTLTTPAMTNGQVQFSVVGEPGVTCVVQSSPDLLNWTPVLTNSDFGPTRILTIDAPNDASYYRAVIPSFPIFGYAMAAATTFNANGNSFTTDSFNSSDTNLSSGGGFYDPSKISTNGDMATVNGIVNIGNHTIDGNLFVGPSVSYIGGTNAVLGSIYTNRTLNFPDAALPPQLFGAVVAPIVGHAPNLTNYLTFDGYYAINNSYPIVVATNVTAGVLVTTANFNLSITLQGGMTNSAVAHIYLGGTDATIVSSSNWRPRNLQIFGLPSLTSVTFPGIGSFVGVIYAPSAIVYLNGGGSSNNTIGSLIAGSIRMNARYDFHFDEDLLTSGP
jgi:hypothetical protein